MKNIFSNPYKRGIVKPYIDYFGKSYKLFRFVISETEISITLFYRRIVISWWRSQLSDKEG